MRSIVVPLSLAVVLLAGCTGKDPSPEQDASEAELQVPEGPVLPPIGARVLIGGQRGLATEPRRDAARVFGAGDELRVAEVVAHVGEFLELRTVAAEPTQVCTAGGVDPSFELRFFALPDELEWVLGKPKQVEFEDGTRLEFAAGVPILRRGP